MPLNNTNFVSLIGYLGQDPTVKTTSAGGIVAEFSMATNDRYTDRNGNLVKSTEWHRIKAFGRIGETLHQYLRKGSRVAILGTIRYHKWTDKHEQSRVNTDIIVTAFEFLSPSRNSRPFPQGDAELRQEAVADSERGRPPEQSLTRPAAYDSDSPEANKKIPF